MHLLPELGKHLFQELVALKQTTPSLPFTQCPAHQFLVTAQLGADVVLQPILHFLLNFQGWEVSLANLKTFYLNTLVIHQIQQFVCGKLALFADEGLLVGVQD